MFWEFLNQRGVNGYPEKQGSRAPCPTPTLKFPPELPHPAARFLGLSAWELGPRPELEASEAGPLVLEVSWPGSRPGSPLPSLLGSVLNSSEPLKAPADGVEDPGITPLMGRAGLPSK